MYPVPQYTQRQQLRLRLQEQYKAQPVFGLANLHASFQK